MLPLCVRSALPTCLPAAGAADRPRAGGGGGNRAVSAEGGWLLGCQEYQAGATHAPPGLAAPRRADALLSLPPALALPAGVATTMFTRCRCSCCSLERHTTGLRWRPACAPPASAPRPALLRLYDRRPAGCLGCMPQVAAWDRFLTTPSMLPAPHFHRQIARPPCPRCPGLTRRLRARRRQPAAHPTGAAVAAADGGLNRPVVRWYVSYKLGCVGTGRYCNEEPSSLHACPSLRCSAAPNPPSDPGPTTAPSTPPLPFLATAELVEQSGARPRLNADPRHVTTPLYPHQQEVSEGGREVHMGGRVLPSLRGQLWGWAVLAAACSLIRHFSVRAATRSEAVD